MKENILKGLIVAVASLTLLGCEEAPVNPVLTSDSFGNGNNGYRYERLQSGRDGSNTNQNLVVLAFSGGGTRAAAFSFGVMEGLQAARYEQPGAGAERSLLEDVDVISSVSGGSFTAAFYGLFRDKFFLDFPEKVLYRDIQGDLIKRALNPINWARMASDSFDRIDLAAEYYHETIFERSTFQRLIDQNKKPYLILNATDMTLGRRFEFTQEQFDYICSDLAGVPVSRAVAASSAFPGLLSPVTLKNHINANCGFNLPPWINDALGVDANKPRRVERARAMKSYRDKTRPWVHLLDGGLSDNIGLRGPLIAFTEAEDVSWSLSKMVNSGQVNRVIVVTANAKSKPHNTWDEERAAPGLFDVLGFVSTGPMDAYSFDTVQLISKNFEQRKRDFLNLQQCRALVSSGQCTIQFPGMKRPLALYSAELSFDGITDASLGNAKGQGAFLRACMEALPTNFSLDRPTVNLLRQVARHLLNVSKGFQQAMRDIDPAWQPRPFAIDSKLVKTVCEKS